jgi:hypothetical protein
MNFSERTRQLTAPDQFDAGTRFAGNVYETIMSKGKISSKA